MKRHEMRNGGGRHRPDTPTQDAPADPLYEPEAGLEVLAQRNFEAFLYPLHGGLLLGNATVDDLHVAISRRRHSALTLFQDARWFEAIASRLPDNDTKVRDVLSEEELVALRTEAVSGD